MDQNYFIFYSSRLKLVGGGGMGDWGGGGGRERDIRYIFSDCFMKTYSVGTH